MKDVFHKSSKNFRFLDATLSAHIPFCEAQIAWAFRASICDSRKARDNIYSQGFNLISREAQKGLFLEWGAAFSNMSHVHYFQSFR